MRGTRIAPALALLVPLACGLLACGVTEPGSDDTRGRDVIDRETFIAVYVELRRAAVEAPDSAGFEAGKREVLERHAVDSAALSAFVEAHADDVGYLSEVWDTIQERLRAEPGRDSARS